MILRYFRTSSESLGRFWDFKAKTIKSISIKYVDLNEYMKSLIILGLLAI